MLLLDFQHTVNYILQLMIEEVFPISFLLFFPSLLGFQRVLAAGFIEGY